MGGVKGGSYLRVFALYPLENFFISMVYFILRKTLGKVGFRVLLCVLTKL